MINRRQFMQTMAAAGFATLGAAQELPYFAIPPTVHHLTENSATLFFWMGTPTTNGKITVRKAGALVQEIPFVTDESLQLQVILQDLEPATQYTYEVLVDGVVPPVWGLETAWDNLNFRTPPYDTPLKVVMVGDSGFGHPNTQRLAELMAQQNPDLFLHLGDVVYWMQEYGGDPYMNWNIKYFKPFQELLKRVPHYPTYGNHEGDAPARINDVPSYYYMFPPFDEGADATGNRSWYSVDYKGIQFISLNSQVFYAFGSLREPQNQWLTERLARTDVHYSVVFFHVAPYTSATPHQWDGNIIAETWVPMFENGNVALVASGHAHVYERLLKNDIHYIVAGSGSDTIYGLGERLRSSLQFWQLTSFPLLEFYEDHIHVKAFSLAGDIIDEADLPIPSK